MLNSIRRQAGSWIVKALLVLLVLSFAVWGIGDIFYGGRQNPTVATVGDSEILASELAAEFDRSLNQIRQRLGPDFDRERAIQLGLMQRALQDLVARRLIDLRAREMGLTVDEATLRQLIVQNPVFQTGGSFDRNRFQQLLLSSGMNEEAYLAALRQDVVRGMLTESLTAPVEVPPTLVETLYRHRNQERTGRMIVVERSAIEDVPEPSEEQLRTYHEEHQDRFRAPEYRRVAFVTLEPEDLLGEVEIGDDAIETTYQERIEQYRTPERRTVTQLLADDEAMIRDAADRVAEGMTLQAAAEGLEGVRFSDLGEVTRGQLPAAMTEAIFEIPEGEVGEPTESPFGWHLFKVDAVEPGNVTPLTEVRDDIERELALEEANARLPSLANALDDELAAGRSLGAAASTLGLEVATVEVDAQGRTPEGERPEGLPEGASFLDVAFDSPEEQTSLLEETEDGSYFVLRVDQVTPARVRPLDEVRDEVIAAWTAEKRGELARQRAEDLLEDVGAGASFAAIADDAGLEPEPIEPVTRIGQGAGQGVEPAAVRALFETEPGAVADRVVEVAEGFALVTTEEVIEADPDAAPDALAQLEDELRQELRNDILTQFGTALRDAYPVEIDMAEVNRLMESDGFAPAGQPRRMPVGTGGGGGVF